MTAAGIESIMTKSPRWDGRTRRTAIAAACALAIIAGAVATSAALQTTAQPGQMTPAQVWVQNRSRAEAVAVDLRDVNLEKPLRVHVVNGEAASGDTMQVRPARQVWEYEMATIPQRTDVAAVLNLRGAMGWEAVGTVNVTPDGITTILMKRPR
jgi:hypothetical protein